MADNWQKTARIFNDKAAEYDGWFADNLVYQIERDALRSLKTQFKSPKIEIGVGPGRFGQDLGTGLGIDPAFATLDFARKRGINVINAVGEHLPIKTASQETAYLLMALCFLNDPRAGLTEIHRILRPGGHLVIGTINKTSPWGKSLSAKKKTGHPFYEHARFYETARIETWLSDSGFTIAETVSSLRQQPGTVTTLEEAQTGIKPQAGFIILVAKKNHLEPSPKDGITMSTAVCR